MSSNELPGRRGVARALPFHGTMVIPRQCPRCRKPGLLRAERVIKAGKGVTELFCGACGYSWTEADDAPPVLEAEQKPLRP